MKALRIVGIVLVAIIILVAVVPLLIPIPPLEDLKPVSQLVDLDSQFIKVDNINVHYKEAGDGSTAIILLHGFGASTYSWRNVLQPLANFGRVIAYDRPAFGLTDRPMPGDWMGESPYSTDAQANMLVDLMTAKGIQKAIMVGNSAGGTVALYTALKYPARVQGLVLVDPEVYGGGPSFPSWLAPLLNTPQAQRIGQLAVRSIQSTGMDLLVKAWYDPNKITPEIISNYRKPLQIADWDRALWQLTIANAPTNIVDRLKELNLPVMVIAGDHDQIVPTEQSVRLSKDIPGAQLSIIKNCGHVPQEECPDAFMSAASEFISKWK
jgi:pimeloyl-ACP methyl ester carboxylesterase